MCGAFTSGWPWNGSAEGVSWSAMIRTMLFMACGTPKLDSG